MIFLYKNIVCIKHNLYRDCTNSFSPNSVCVVSSSMDESVPLIGRPYGGCSIIWSTNISCKLDTIESISKRLCAVKVTVDSIEFILFNAYMPCEKGYANHYLFEYIDVLNEVSDICNKTASQHFVLGGDFNTDLTSDTLQTRALRSFANNEQLCYVLMPNVIIYLIHTAQRAMAVCQQ